jgi:hypothetical protein
VLMNSSGNPVGPSHITTHQQQQQPQGYGTTPVPTAQQHPRAPPYTQTQYTQPPSQATPVRPPQQWV